MNGIVYKGESASPYESAYNYLGGGVLPEGCDKQILQEIDYFYPLLPTCSETVFSI